MITATWLLGTMLLLGVFLLAMAVSWGVIGYVLSLARGPLRVDVIPRYDGRLAPFQLLGRFFYVGILYQPSLPGTVGFAIGLACAMAVGEWIGLIPF